uniref:PRA1 family protein n=1 Tax=Oryza nivara TaxID=4536 RepID=A0A0E0FHM5_ORYNI
MSKYGTIPTSSSSSSSGAAPPPLPLGGGGGASPLDFFSRAKARGATALATRRPWRELADPHALGLPPSLADAYLRVRANLAHYAMNYAIVVLAVVFLSLLWHPASLIVFLVCMVAWLVLYFLRDEPIVLFGRVVGDGAVLAALAAVTLVLLLLTGATANIVSSLLIGVLLVVLHAALHKAEENVDDEVGRWYTPVPPQPAHYRARRSSGPRGVAFCRWMNGLLHPRFVFPEAAAMAGSRAGSAQVHDEEESLVNLVHPFSCVFSTDEKGISHSSRAKNPTSSRQFSFCFPAKIHASRQFLMA